METSSTPFLRMPSVFFTSSGMDSVCGGSSTSFTSGGGGAVTVFSWPLAVSPGIGTPEMKTANTANATRATPTVAADFTHAQRLGGRGMSLGQVSRRLGGALRLRRRGGFGSRVGTRRFGRGFAVQGLFDGGAEFVEVERLDHHASEAAADLRVFAEPDRVGGHEDQRQVGLAFAQAVGQPHAVAVRQRQIDQGQRTACARRPAPAPRRRRPPARRCSRRASGRGRARRGARCRHRRAGSSGRRSWPRQDPRVAGVGRGVRECTNDAEPGRGAASRRMRRG